MKKKRRKNRHVYISKAYFPRALWPKGITDQFEGWHYLTATRQEAADAAWAEHGERLLPLMNPQVKYISLYVDGETPNNCAGRLSPVRVHVRLTPVKGPMKLTLKIVDQNGNEVQLKDVPKDQLSEVKTLCHNLVGEAEMIQLGPDEWGDNPGSGVF